MQRDSWQKTLLVTVVLCLVCSLLVSAAAVGLRDFQQANKRREMQRNVLVAAGLFEEGVKVEEAYKNVRPAIVDLRTGEVMQTEAFTSQLGLTRLEEYDQRRAAKVEDLSVRLPLTEDVAAIRRREHYAYVFFVKQENEPDLIVLPIRGYGLWSTLYGFIALDLGSLQKGPEQAEIRGLTFYEHGETPGLGGEVDNPRWKARWVGKKVFDENWNVVIEVVKSITEKEHQVDALSGATITSNGVTSMLQFWLGEQGFGPFLKRLAEAEMTD